jgi:hypothetical protein
MKYALNFVMWLAVKMLVALSAVLWDQLNTSDTTENQNITINKLYSHEL